MGKFRRIEDEADKWLREHDPYYTDKRKNKQEIYNTYYETPEKERRTREKEIPISNCSLKDTIHSYKKGLTESCYDNLISITIDRHGDMKYP